MRGLESQSLRTWGNVVGVFEFSTVELWNWVSNEILVQYISVSLRCYCASKIRRKSLHLVCCFAMPPPPCPKNYGVLNVMYIWRNFKILHNVGA